MESFSVKSPPPPKQKSQKCNTTIFDFAEICYDYVSELDLHLYPAIKALIITLWRNKTMLLLSLTYFSFQPVHHNWYNKGHGMCYPTCGIVHIKDPSQLKKISHVAAAGFLSSEWFFTICPMPYNHK